MNKPRQRTYESHGSSSVSPNRIRIPSTGHVLDQMEEIVEQQKDFGEYANKCNQMQADWDPRWRRKKEVNAKGQSKVVNNGHISNVVQR